MLLTNLEDKDNVDSFASSLASSSGEEPIPEDNMDNVEYHDAEDAAPPSDNPPDQGAAVAEFNPTNLEANHTKKIIDAVRDLDMDSTENNNADASEEDNKQSEKTNLVQKMGSTKSKELMI